MISIKNSLLVDVREKQEFSGGHNQYSINIPLSEIQKGNIEKIKNSGKENILVACLSGARASIAEMFLKKQGVKQKITNYGSWQNFDKLK